jgi:phosphatidylglycerophosphatase A
MKPTTDGSALIPTSNKKPLVSILIATAFGLGLLPKAPGTFGSLGGIAIALLLNWIDLRVSFVTEASRVPYFWSTRLVITYAVMVFIAILGVIASDRAACHAQIKDPQWVVIDEVSGQLITYFAFLFLAPFPVNWKTLLLGFILFRLFDIWKPFPARQLENLPGGWGIMADDWMAGIYAAILLQVALHFRLL